MSPTTISVLVGILFLVIVGFDIYLATDSIKGNTYSARIRQWGRKWKWFPYVISLGFGALTGHFFL